MSGQTTALAGYRNSPAEIAGMRGLTDIVPKNLSTVLDIGTRDTHFSAIDPSEFTLASSLQSRTK